MIEQKKPMDPIPVTPKLLDEWATDDKGTVALHLKQKLLPIEESENHGGIVFPPTYADIGYNVDPLPNGTKVATIDSVGSQANRMEPLFKEGGPLAELVPQIRIKINAAAEVSIFDLPHRAADATVQSSPGLAKLAEKAFQDLKDGNAATLCTLAPTSLVFGVWDSRGKGEKRPRLVRSVIRAWEVEVLHAAAQFNSIWKKLDEEQQKALNDEAKKKNVKLSNKGFDDAPATFRKTKVPESKLPKYRDGVPNPEARVLGGVLVKGPIEREVTVNLLALRGLRGGEESTDKTVTDHLRRYLLGLTLLAATSEMDLFLREGCLLRYGGDDDTWYALPRRGDPQPVNFSGAHTTIKNWMEPALQHFRAKWPDLFKDKWPKQVEEGKRPVIEYQFDINEAKRLLARRTEEEEIAES
jgi:CRISPR-associated protein Csb1